MLKGLISQDVEEEENSLKWSSVTEELNHIYIYYTPLVKKKKVSDTIITLVSFCVHHSL